MFVILSYYMAVERSRHGAVSRPTMLLPSNFADAEVAAGVAVPVGASVSRGIDRRFHETSGVGTADVGWWRIADQIQLISGSIAIHLALAQAAGTLDAFLQVSLPDEIAELQRVRSLLHERRSFIHEKHPELRESVTAVCDRLEDVARIYRPMIMQSASHLSQV